MRNLLLANVPLLVAAVIAGCLIYSAEVKVSLGLGEYLSTWEITRMANKTMLGDKSSEKALTEATKGIEKQSPAGLKKLLRLIKLKPQDEIEETSEPNLSVKVLIKVADEISNRLIKIYKNKPMDIKVDGSKIGEFFAPRPVLLIEVWHQAHLEAEKIFKKANESDGEKKDELLLQAVNLFTFSRDCLKIMEILEYLEENNKSTKI